VQTQRVKRFNSPERIQNQQFDAVVEVVERGLKKAVGADDLKVASAGTAAGMLLLDTPFGPFYVPVYSSVSVGAPTPPTPSSSDENEDMLQGGEPIFFTTYSLVGSAPVTAEHYVDASSVLRLSVDYTWAGTVLTNSVRKVFDSTGALWGQMDSVYTWAGPTLTSIVSTRVV
jgi:hypothetical protein